MKIAKDIRSVIHGDIEALYKAMSSGEIGIGAKLIPEIFSRDELLQLSEGIYTFIIEKRPLAPVMQYLGTMTWLTLHETCIYARASRNTIINWLRARKITGTRIGGKGDWIVLRQSIDDFYYKQYNDAKLKEAELREDLQRRASWLRK